MQNGTILALALTALAATGLSATCARANQWCGSAMQKGAVVQCGYRSSADCETAVGKGGMCFVDPDVALDATRAAPTNSTKLPPRG